MAERMRPHPFKCLIRHEWTEGLTTMDEDAHACRQCHLTFEAWESQRPVRLFRRFVSLGVLLAAIFALSFEADPWRRIGLTIFAALACALVASFL